MADAKMYSALKIGIDDRFVPLHHLLNADQTPEFSAEFGLDLAADRQFPTWCAHAQRIGADARKRGLTAIDPIVTHESSTTQGVKSHRLVANMGTVQEGFLQFTAPMGAYVPTRDSTAEGAELEQQCTDAAVQLTLALITCHQADTPLAVTAGLRSISG